MQKDFSDNYIKIFFEKTDFLIWNRLYPFSEGMALKLINQE
jgi:hypothetical protein